MIYFWESPFVCSAFRRGQSLCIRYGFVFAAVEAPFAVGGAPLAFGTESEALLPAVCCWVAAVGLAGAAVGTLPGGELLLPLAVGVGFIAGVEPAGLLPPPFTGAGVAVG